MIGKHSNEEKTKRLIGSISMVHMSFKINQSNIPKGSSQDSPLIFGI